ncbi:hypothetical protein HF521_016514 [Silurus meridionalis]|uniref:Uncharacterized protein n=1 Tax=Silurus meridionalis TaxID=175797 RepID=A0A8T0BRK5_SILME|nr:hypothetical protein HF521_016514 [Silurus meridionalis]
MTRCLLKLVLLHTLRLDQNHGMHFPVLKVSKASVLSESEVCVLEFVQVWKPWTLPSPSTSITTGESDQELQTFIMMRNQVDKEDWEKLNYDIYALQYARRMQVCFGVFLAVTPGYQREVYSLLAVNRQSVISNGGNLERARELLYTVCNESCLFLGGIEPNDRFLFVMKTSLPLFALKLTTAKRALNFGHDDIGGLRITCLSVHVSMAAGFC